MNTTALWPTVLEMLEALGTHYGLAMDRAAAELGLPEWKGWLLPAAWFDPEPISAKRLRVRSPYTSARSYNERLAKAAGQGYLALVADAEGEYRLTELGKRAADHVIAAVYAKLSALEPTSAPELDRLASLLHRLVTSCLAAAEPPGKWCILQSRRTDPGDTASVVIRIDQYGTDLASYRDDAHLAAWQSHNVEGHAWEALTCIWRGEATTLDGLSQRLERRGYGRDEYGQALQDLAQRGWVTEKAGEFSVTALGQEIRQAAEEATDQFFYAPWSCLSQGETQELQTLAMLYAGKLKE